MKESRRKELRITCTNGTCPFSAARCIGVLEISFLASIFTLARNSIRTASILPICSHMTEKRTHMTGKQEKCIHKTEKQDNVHTYTRQRNKTKLHTLYMTDTNVYMYMHICVTCAAMCSGVLWMESTVRHNFLPIGSFSSTWLIGEEVIVGRPYIREVSSFQRVLCTGVSGVGT